VTVLVTWRAEDVLDGSLLRRLSARLPAGASWERITLGPPDVTATAELVASMLPGGQVSPEFAKFLHARTDGLPLAIEESVRLLRDRRDLRPQGGAWVRRHLDVLAVPPTIRDAVLERAARLSTEAAAVLRAAAVLGEPADEPVLMSVADLAWKRAQAGLGEALGSGLVIENRSPAGQTVVFRHALAARAVYDAIPAPLRRDMHERAGQALQDTIPLPLARLVHHFREAGDRSRSTSECYSHLPGRLTGPPALMEENPVNYKTARPRCG
jgi:predicted ATPase